MKGNGQKQEDVRQMMMMMDEELLERNPEEGKRRSKDPNEGCFLVFSQLFCDLKLSFK